MRESTLGDRENLTRVVHDAILTVGLCVRVEQNLVRRARWTSSPEGSTRTAKRRCFPWNLSLVEVPLDLEALSADPVSLVPM
jgi:hypothetical protein